MKGKLIEEEKMGRKDSVNHLEELQQMERKLREEMEDDKNREIRKVREEKDREMADIKEELTEL
jgi:hypothetical protein